MAGFRSTLAVNLRSCIQGVFLFFSGALPRGLPEEGPFLISKMVSFGPVPAQIRGVMVCQSSFGPWVQLGLRVNGQNEKSRPGHRNSHDVQGELGAPRSRPFQKVLYGKGRDTETL